MVYALPVPVVSFDEFTVIIGLRKQYFNASATFNKSGVYVENPTWKIKFRDIVRISVQKNTKKSQILLETEKAKFEICVEGQAGDAFVLHLRDVHGKFHGGQQFAPESRETQRPHKSQTFKPGSKRPIKRNDALAIFLDPLDDEDDSMEKKSSHSRDADDVDLIDSDEDNTNSSHTNKLSRQSQLRVNSRLKKGQSRQSIINDVIQNQTVDATLTPSVNARVVSPVGSNITVSSVQSTRKSENDNPKPLNVGAKKVARSKDALGFFQPKRPRLSPATTPAVKALAPARQSPCSTSVSAMSSRALDQGNGNWLINGSRSKSEFEKKRKPIAVDCSDERKDVMTSKERRKIPDEDPIEEYSQTPPTVRSPVRRLPFGSHNTNLSSRKRITPMRLDLSSDRPTPPTAPSWSVVPVPQRHRFRGLRNLGNTCYLNASLQMLFTCVDQMSGLRKSRGDRLTQSLGWVSRQLEKEDDQRLPFEHVSPLRVKDAIDSRTDKFAASEQRDAHEFLSDLIDYVHEEVITENKRENDVSDPQTQTVYSPMDDFSMTLLVSLQCCSCRYSRNKEEMYRHLSIDIVPDHKQSTGESSTNSISPASIDESLAAFFRPEVRELKCEMCDNGTHAEQTLRILSRPRVLLLHLKRFIVVERPIVVETSNDENAPPNDSTDPVPVEYIFQKNKAPVSIQPEISLDSFSVQHDSNPKTPACDATNAAKYTLMSIVHHIGSRASSGHYTADAVRIDHDHPNGTTEATSKPVWVSFDDTFTSRTTLTKIVRSQFKQQSAYMLLYSFGDTTSAYGDEEQSKKALISPSDSELL